MRDFIIGVSSTPTSQGPLLPGGMSISNDVLVIAVVVALTFLMWLMLRETFGARRQLRERLITFPLYVFLAIWSIGFGYGFWWSLISGEEATRTGLAGLQEDARDASAVVAARLDAVRGQLDSVVSWSESQMSREETSGGSCGTASGAGRGPLYNARRSVRDSVNTLREGMTRSWLEPVQADIDELKQTAAEPRRHDRGGAPACLRGQRLRHPRARAQHRGPQQPARPLDGRRDARDRHPPSRSRRVLPASPATTPRSPSGCARPPPRPSSPPSSNCARRCSTKARPGVANAVKNLWRNIGAYSSSLVGYLFSGGKASGGRTDTRRADHRARPDRAARHHRHRPGAAGARHPQPAARAAVDPAVGRAERARSRRRSTPPSPAPASTTSGCGGISSTTTSASYFVIPNLYCCRLRATRRRRRVALAMNQLAGVLSDLELVRWPDGAGPRWFRLRKSELERLKTRGRPRERHRPDRDAQEVGGGEARDPRPRAEHSDRPIRNHGLFSKAERALEIAGWSQSARDDIEVFRLVDTEGLTPLLMVLNEPRPHGEARAEPAAA